MNSITRLVIAVCGTYVRGRHPVSRAGRQADRPGQGGGVQWQEDRDEGQRRGRLPPVFHGGEELEATTDGLKNTDVHLFVYDSSGAEVAKDDSPGPKCSVKVTPEKDGQYKFVIKNAGGTNTVTFNVKVAK